MANTAAPNVVAATELEAFASRLLEGGGFTNEHAVSTARLLVWANLRGVDSHGVLRIPRYLEMVRSGAINPGASIRVARSFGATSIIECDRAPAATAMAAAVLRARDAARIAGIGWCAARNTTHAGAIGYFAEQIARAGQIGIVMTASKPLMTYYGSRIDGVSTNPMSIAVPATASRWPILFDMSTSAAALGKVMAAKEAGRPIPLGWAVDASGAETTDPAAVKSLLPLGGAKGSGLSLMIEVLSSVLAGNPLISRALNGDGVASFNGIAIAVQIEAFEDPDTFARDVGALVAAIKGLPVAAGFDRVRLPGERGYEVAERQSSTGIALEPATAKSLAKLAATLDVPIPTALS